MPKSGRSLPFLFLLLFWGLLLGLPSPCYAQWFGFGRWGQKNAGRPGQVPPICEAERMPNPNFDDISDLVDKLRDGEIEPAAWQRCAQGLLLRLPPPLAAELIDRMGKTYRKLLRDRDLDQDPVLQAQLQALHQIYLHRSAGIHGSAEVMNSLLADLTKALANHKLGPLATKYGGELLATVDLERGYWQGAPVNVAALDRILTQGDEALLIHFAKRLPDPALRIEARRRVVRLRLFASGYPELRTRSAEVEEVVLAQGSYPLPLLQHPPVRATLDPQHLVIDGAVLQQNALQQTVALLLHNASPGGSMLATIPLRGALLIQVQGLARPVTVCGPSDPEALDPIPCVPPQELRSLNALAQVTGDGTLVFVPNLPMAEALALAEPGSTVSILLRIGSTPIYEQRLGVRFENPKSFILQPDQPGGVGPNLDVYVDNSNPQRLLYRVLDGRHTFVVVVERDHAPLQVASQGGFGRNGHSGQFGAHGHDGRSGRAARCPSDRGQDGEHGGDGGDGGAGGSGGPGGNGGDVRVRVLCSRKPCDSLVEQLHSNVLSLAGPGGAAGSGGPGGQGGYGGSGGSSTSCNGGSSSYSLESGRHGETGRRGVDGPEGQSGRDGAPGRVFFQAVP